MKARDPTNLAVMPVDKSLEFQSPRQVLLQPHNKTYTTVYCTCSIRDELH
jgi:hypothetical protein